MLNIFSNPSLKCRIHSSLQSISDVRFMNLNDQAFADLLTRKKHIFNVYCQLFSYQHSSKYLLLCSTKERNPYKFGRTWGWVNDDRIFIFGWTILFTHWVSGFWLAVNVFITHQIKIFCAVIFIDLTFLLNLELLNLKIFFQILNLFSFHF